MESIITAGQIIACSESNDLTAVLSSGEIVTIPAAEASRRGLKASARWLLGKTLGMIQTEEGICSIKAYEEQSYRQIVMDCFAGERNVYEARLASVSHDGLVFYKLDPLAEGVVGSIHPSDLSLVALNSFDGIELPKVLPVTIKKVSGGKIILSAWPAYGTFEENVDRLGLQPGSTVEGYVSSTLPNGKAIVSLTPNLNTLLSNGNLLTGMKVRVTVADICTEDQKLRCTLDKVLEDNAPFPADFFAGPFADLPGAIDLTSHLRQIKPKKTAPVPVEPQDIPRPSYILESDVSPFRLDPAETARHSGATFATPKTVARQVQLGHLNEKHLLVAKAINRLRFATSYQIIRYLDCGFDYRITDGIFRRALDHLLSLNIIQKLEIGTADRQHPLQVFCPGMNYSAFAGERATLGHSFFAHQPDALVLKSSLAANQLLLGLMHSRELTEENHLPHPRLEYGDVRVSPRHRVTDVSGEVFYLEALRGEDRSDIFGKLKRYEACSAAGEKFTVICTLEEEVEIDSFAEQVRGLELPFEVQLTADLSCLPAPITVSIPAACKSKKTLFGRIKQFFFDAASA